MTVDAVKTFRRVPPIAGCDFARQPFVVIWETTRACDLACRHCRASAIARRDPLELGTAEARALMDTVRGFGHPLFVLTGGDPLKRPDTVGLVEHGARIGLFDMAWNVLCPGCGGVLDTNASLKTIRKALMACIERRLAESR